VALAPGTPLGSYTITSQIGLGGMGVVYRARDTKLKRDVAIKMLPRDVASDADRLARLQREAEVLASLNHPNIAHLYGIEGRDETTALVMELVEGPTLADRIAAGAIPIDEALPIIRQIVDALETAHEQGVVHRDMKPANIKLRLDGVVKVLDFGLAKALDPASSQSSHSLAPTMTTPAATEAGSILGTAPYMSPEQAIGKPVDKRTDIWAFGCTVYEMLTGTSPFARETKAETLVAILEREPDWAALPSSTPAGVRRLVARCLTKDARRRLRDIGDARVDLDVEASAGEASMPRRSSSRPLIVQSVAALVLTAAVTGSLVWIFKPSPAGRPSPSVARLVIVPPPGEAIDAGNFGVAISPDGRRVAYVAGGADRKRIYVRDVEQFESLPLPGSEGGDAPFFAGRTVGRLRRRGEAPEDALRRRAAPDGDRDRADGECLRGGELGTGRQHLLHTDARNGHLARPRVGRDAGSRHDAAGVGELSPVAPAAARRQDAAVQRRHGLRFAGVRPVTRHRRAPPDRQRRRRALPAQRAPGLRTGQRAHRGPVRRESL
jgi:serine/threonine protein kinase